MNKVLGLKKGITSLVFGAMSLCAVSGVAHAGSVTQPGETVGVGLGNPLPEGFYFGDTFSVGDRKNNNEGVNIPLILWSTPLVIAGGHIEALVAAPELWLGNNGNHGTGGMFDAGMYNPFAAAMIAWNFGNIGASYLAGVYFGIKGGDFGNAFDQDTFRQDVHLSYANQGWSANANLIYGIVGKNDATKAANPDYFNYDLSVTKAVGKWELGPVAFGSTDTNSPKGAAAQSQFAVGGLVGYNFGPVITQFYVTQDVSESNYGGKDTRGWMRAIVPF